MLSGHQVVWRSCYLPGELYRGLPMIIARLTTVWQNDSMKRGRRPAAIDHQVEAFPANMDPNRPCGHFEAAAKALLTISVAHTERFRIDRKFLYLLLNIYIIPDFTLSG